MHLILLSFPTSPPCEISLVSVMLRFRGSSSSEALIGLQFLCEDHHTSLSGENRNVFLRRRDPSKIKGYFGRAFQQRGSEPNSATQTETPTKMFHFPQTGRSSRSLASSATAVRQLLLFRVIFFSPLSSFFFFCFFASSYWRSPSLSRAVVSSVQACEGLRSDEFDSGCSDPPSPGDSVAATRSESELRSGASAAVEKPKRVRSSFAPPRLSGPHESFSARRNLPSCSSIYKYIFPRCLSVFLFAALHVPALLHLVAVLRFIIP